MSGDAQSAVQRLANHCGIKDFAARRSPLDKLERVRALTSQGEFVAMVGDGINDAPVLGGAGVSIAMSRGSALALASSDLVLVGDSLQALPAAFAVARRARRVIRQNLLWAAGYNLTAMPLAALGWVPPWLAAIGMSLSSIVVVLNSLRLMRSATPVHPADRHPTAAAIDASAAVRQFAAMSIIFVLIPVSLVLVGLGLWAFFWAVRNGQFDELDSPAWDILVDDEPKAAREIK